MGIVSRLPGIPAHLQRTFETMPTGGSHSAQALAAVGLKSADWQVVPLEPGGKRIDASTPFRHGRKQRLPDIGDVLDLWQTEPTRNVGIVPSVGTLCVDLDTKHGAGLHTLEALGLPQATLTERTRSGGWHCWYRLPRGFKAGKGSTGNSRLPAGVDLIVDTGLVVSPWSIVDGGIYRYETDAWELARVPDDWQHLGLLIDVEAVAFGKVSRHDRAKARVILHRMRKGSEQRAEINRLFSEWWKSAIAMLAPTATDFSESHRDFLLAFLATNYLRYNPRSPQILYALLWETGWPQNPLRNNPKSNPQAYTRTIALRATAARAAKDHARIANLAESYGLPGTGADAPKHRSGANVLRTFPDTARGGKPLICQGKPGVENDGEIGADIKLEMAAECIAIFAAEVMQRGDLEFLRSEGFVRVPCGDFAAAMEVSTDTITRAIHLGTERGWWEPWIWRYRYDGGPACDSHVRLIGVEK